MDLERYQRQMIVPEIGADGQEKLSKARILIIGIGGLGTIAAEYLARAGIGSIGLCDFDTVSRSNLHRQVLFTDNDIGKKKTEAAMARLIEINPGIVVNTHDKADAIHDYDIILDCTDNQEARYVISDLCKKHKKPHIFGAAIQLSGQMAVFMPGGPCYRCLHPVPSEQKSCSEAGILGPVCGMIGSMQALEAMKLITGLTPMKGLYCYENGRIIALEIETMEGCG